MRNVLGKIRIIITKLLHPWKFDKKCGSKHGVFSGDEDVIKKINFGDVIKRIVKFRNDDLLLDPIALKDLHWFVQNNERDLKKIILDKYCPSPQETYSMPKKSFSYRPISYLQPLDSLIYQALIDKLIRHRRTKFSQQVYSHIINDINKAEIFHNPVQHWLEMRDNIRQQYKKGFRHYFFADISGYFENVKIKKLMEILNFYVERNGANYSSYLELLLCKWQYAIAQGLIQTHPASSILAKVYLNPIDSKLNYLGKNYNRYVDEFHILARTKHDLFKITLQINEALRELGLNINVAKSKYFEGEDILKEINEEKDFFDGVSYLENVVGKHDEAYEVIKARYEKLVKSYGDKNEVNLKIFRYCIHKFGKKMDPIATSLCLDFVRDYPEQTVNIVRYLNIFINNNDYSSEILGSIFDFLKNDECNLYNWQQIWLLALIHESRDKNKIDFRYIWGIVQNKNQDVLSRSICLLILTKHLEDHNLTTLMDMYKKADSLILRRTILYCLAKLPSTLTEDIFKVKNDDDLSIAILKQYLKYNKIEYEKHTIL